MGFWCWSWFLVSNSTKALLSCVLELSGVGRFESEHFRVRNCLGMTEWGVPCSGSCVSLALSQGQEGVVLCSWGDGWWFLPGPSFLECLCVSYLHNQRWKGQLFQNCEFEPVFFLCFFYFPSAQEVTSWFWSTLLSPCKILTGALTLSERFLDSDLLFPGTVWNLNLLGLHFSRVISKGSSLKCWTFEQNQLTCFPEKRNGKGTFPSLKGGYHCDLVLISCTPERAAGRKLGTELTPFQRNDSQCTHGVCLGLMGICIENSQLAQL